MNLKKFLKYLLYLFPWFISVIFVKIDSNYYQELTLPFFAPPKILFPIIWTILYILISIAIYQTLKKANSNYKIYLLINYLANQLYTTCFFIFKNNLLSLTDCLITLLSSMYLYLEVKDINKKSSTYLIPYIIWNLYATILSLSILLLN